MKFTFLILSALALTFSSGANGAFAGQKHLSKTSTILTNISPNEDGELSMIQLQSIVSQRQLTLQMATKMLGSMNEGMKGIVSNIGKDGGEQKKKIVSRRISKTVNQDIGNDSNNNAQGNEADGEGEAEAGNADGGNGDGGNGDGDNGDGGNGGDGGQ